MIYSVLIHPLILFHRNYRQTFNAQQCKSVIWSSKSCFLSKVAPQIIHLDFFFSPWTSLICLFTLLFLENIFLQVGQVTSSSFSYCFFPSWACESDFYLWCLILGSFRKKVSKYLVNTSSLIRVCTIRVSYSY